MCSFPHFLKQLSKPPLLLHIPLHRPLLKLRIIPNLPIILLILSDLEWTFDSDLHVLMLFTQ